MQALFMKSPIILSIDTSCDETSVAITQGRKVLANTISSQVALHKKYGGVYPSLAKRTHEQKIDLVVEKALTDAKKLKPNLKLNAVAVTQGPGLAIALEVGIKKAKVLSSAYKLPLIAVNHLEGHIYACLAQNSQGQPQREMLFPSLCLVVSGGHTGLYLTATLGQYQLLGETLDDACGEALDKAAKILKLGYPGGPIIERLAEKQELNPKFKLTPPLKAKTNLSFSYSGLKTQFLYLVQSLSDKDFSQNLGSLALAFQTACFEQVIRKTTQAVRTYQPKMLLCGGGVIRNKTLRKNLRQLARDQNLKIFFPLKKNLITDNAAMIGVAASFKFQRNDFVKNLSSLDRLPRFEL